ncbi:MAG: DinB family protein [Candidatus Doudnabacteria bacterium]
MDSTVLVTQLLNELEAETSATHKCLERIPERLWDWKPHPRSMSLGSLAFIVAEIPRWILTAITESEIDFAAFKHMRPDSTEKLARFFDDNMKAAKNALINISDLDLAQTFYLKMNGQVLFTSSKLENIGSSVRHLVHHRGQLTVFMRLKDIPVPQVYGPSADEQGF